MLTVSYLVHYGTLSQNATDIIKNVATILQQRATKVYYKMRQAFYYKTRQSFYTMRGL